LPVLPLTTSRCVSCGAKIAPVTARRNRDGGN